MAEPDRDELEERCERLLEDGQQVTARIEQLLQTPGYPEAGGFDTALERLRREQENIHSQLEQVLQQLQHLDGAS